jgi:predicted transposase/invertase (TIGR01784 family)
MAYRDNKNVLDTAHIEGFDEGLAQGKAQGKAEGLAEGEAKERVKNARNFKRLGVDHATIAQATGLSVAEIEKL